MNTNTKLIIIVIAGLVLTTTQIQLYDEASNENDYEYLWNMEAKIASNPDPLWFTRGHREGEESNEWTFVADKLRDAYTKEGKFEDTYVDIVGNSHNNTIFVVLASLENGTKTEILSLMNPPSGITVKFLKGVAPQKMLKQWYNGIDFEELKTKIGWTGSVITCNGTILISVETITPDVIEYVNTGLEGKVPPGVIVLEEAPSLEDT